MNKKLRKEVRAAIVKHLRDVEHKRTPIDEILMSVACEFGILRSDVVAAISNKEEENETENHRSIKLPNPLERSG